MPKIIKNGRVYGGAPSESVWEGTQEQYDAIVNKDPNIIYYITDGSVEPIPATNIEYDNSLSGLSATQVQSAIDETTGAIKALDIPNGTYIVSGIWSENFYGSRTLFIYLHRADLYTITLTRARYANTSTSLTDITSTTSIATPTVLGFSVNTTSNVDNHFGDVQFTISKT